MQDYTIQDTTNNQQQTHQNTQQQQTGTIQQSLPQTGVTDAVPQLAFGFSLGLLVGLTMIKLAVQRGAGRNG